MIVLVASSICLLSLLLAPERGMLLRMIRIARFRYRCMCENLLKAIWRFGTHQPVIFDQIAKTSSASKLYLRFVLWRLVRSGWVTKTEKGAFELTKDVNLGSQNCAFASLWEVYLVDYLDLELKSTR